jgi:hypothetical protein
MEEQEEKERQKEKVTTMKYSSLHSQFLEMLQNLQDYIFKHLIERFIL